VLERVEEALSRLDLRSCKVLVAASGGLDSTVLAHALHALRGPRELKLALGHVNHGLRGAESDADERAVADLARRLGADFACERVDPGARRAGSSSRERPTPQEAARSLRREALERLRLRTGCQRIATAHQADDQAETVLMRLLRGCGPDSLGGIGETGEGGTVVRPLLAIPRAELQAWAREQGLAWREDASNDDPRYTRARIRRQLLPGLIADFNPRLLRAVGDLAEAQRREAEWLESLVDEQAARVFDRSQPACLGIRADAWQQLPEALARRLAKRALVEQGAGRDLSRAHLMRVVAFLREGRVGSEIQLPGGLRLRRSSVEAVRLARG